MGNPYIYYILNWEHPDKALITIIGVLILVIVVHVFLFLVSHLRVFVQQQYSTVEIDTGEGHINQAFTISSNVI